VRVAFPPRPGLKPQRSRRLLSPSAARWPALIAEQTSRLPPSCAALRPFWGAARPVRGSSVAVKATINASPEHREEHPMTYDETTLPFDPITSEQVAGSSPSARLLDDLQRGHQVADLPRGRRGRAVAALLHFRARGIGHGSAAKRGRASARNVDDGRCPVRRGDPARAGRCVAAGRLPHAGRRCCVARDHATASLDRSA